MPRGAGIQLIDWGKQENTERLLAAILAAQGMKMDYQRVANMFGYGATYSSIACQLCKCKRIAATLPDDHDHDHDDEDIKKKKKKKKSEEIDITDDETKEKTPSKVSKATHLSSGRVKRSSRIQSSAGLSDEIVPKEGGKKVEMAGKKVVGGRVVKKESGTSITGRKKATKEEDEVKLIEVVRLE